MSAFWKVMLILAIALFVAYLLSPGAEAVMAPEAAGDGGSWEDQVILV